MVDSETIRRITSAASIKGSETILEIGAGKGELTASLSIKAKSVIAIEKDRALYRILMKRFKKRRGVRLIQGNALKEIGRLKFDKIVSNLPYSICEPLFRKLPCTGFREGFFTLPKGFASKLSHLPYSAFFSARILFEVPKQAFKPRPRTSSVFVHVKRKQTLLGAALLKGRSKLKNALREALVEGSGMTKNQAREALKGINLTSLGEKKVVDLDSHDLAFLEKLELPVNPKKN